MDIALLQSRMRSAFRVEAEDLLAELDSSMLDLESRPQDTDLLNRVFRAIHTIKGSGATAGFNEMAAFTHHVEELFDEARMGRLSITREMIDLALRAKDLISQLLDSESPQSLEPACAEIVRALAGFLPHKSQAKTPGRPAASGHTARTNRYRIFFKPHTEVFFSGTDPANLIEELAALGQAKVTAIVDSVPPLDSLNPEQCYLAWNVELVCPHPLEKIREVFLFVEDESEIRIDGEAELPSRELEASGTDATFQNIAEQSIGAIDGFLHDLQAGAGTDPGVGENYLRVLKSFLAASRHQNKTGIAALLEEQIQILDSAKDCETGFSVDEKDRLTELHRKLTSAARASDGGMAVMDEAVSTSPERPGLDASTPSAAAPKADNTRKDTSNAPSTIRVDQDKLDRLMRAVGELLVARNAFPILAKRLSMDHDLGGMGKEVKDAGAQISRIAEDLQAAVMSIRMLPIRTVFQRFPRLVRDICRAQGKEVELVLEGENTELDKTVIEQIGDPLVHLVRNAVDHGIESPESREQAGKARTGTVRLRAYGKGNDVVLEVQDDGRGMDPERIKQKAREKGLIAPGDLASMSESAALDLIFLPGLTTAEKVTDISGRGVGMDVVRSNIRKLHGTIALESQRGRGSKIVITLPTSLMVSRGILVESNGEEYIFPIESIAEMVHLRRDRIRRHDQQHFASVRNEVFSVLRLAEHFGGKNGDHETEWPDIVPLAIVQTGQERVGVAVDRFVSDVEAIVKPMGSEFTEIRAFRGATIMGDGRVVLVVNPAEFI
jgi:two-component system chemotaxis sensor kinase CheA